MNISVDKFWFDEKFDQKGLSLRDVAKAIGIDPGALSRTLNGKRKISVVEVAKIATVLGVSQSEVLSHVTANVAGAKLAEREVDRTTRGAPNRRHPLFGCMKGVLTIPPGVDLTEPADPGLADYLDRKYGSSGDPR
ncbi:helix-turn-helix transcriptional regulator [Mesorhizobium sp. CC13]|uniref:helix-turn-helix domain-containing protein n=1 Tax=Mesorhizobium sp. CC13 TaxID=3029194 RepID=UPI0032650985